MTEETLYKASLKIKLYANDLLIAESENPKLWQKVLAQVTAQDEGSNERLLSDPNAEEKNQTLLLESQSGTDPLQQFAQEIGTTKEIALGACRPTTSPPYITLQRRYWEAFLKNTPRRGPNSISRIGLAGTLLCLWFEHSGMETRPTISECQAVLGTINAQDSNPTRSLDNSPWLQKSGNGLVINPAMSSRASEVAKFYCTSLN